MSITLMHYFYTKICSVDNVSPTEDKMTAGVYDRLIEVKTIKIKEIEPLFGEDLVMIHDKDLVEK